MLFCSSVELIAWFLLPAYLCDMSRFKLNTTGHFVSSCQSSSKTSLNRTKGVRNADLQNMKSIAIACG